MKTVAYALAYLSDLLDNHEAILVAVPTTGLSESPDRVRPPSDWPPARGRRRRLTATPHTRRQLSQKKPRSQKPTRPALAAGRVDICRQLRSLVDLSKKSRVRTLVGSRRGPPRKRARHRCRLGPGLRSRGNAPEGPGGFSKEILRKEVIQPQVPLRLPCYDLVPITGFIFGACR
jgi:hypothetical protein